MKWVPFKALQAAPTLPLGDPNRMTDLRQRQQDARIRMGQKSLIARPYNEELRRQGKL